MIPEKFRYANVKIAPGAYEEVNAYIGKKWKAMDKYHTYESRLYDHALAETHALFGDISYIVGFIAFLAIVHRLFGIAGYGDFCSRDKDQGNWHQEDHGRPG